MSPGSEAKRGEAAWKEHLETIKTRNSEARKRARAERSSTDAETAARRRADAEGEAEQLRELNERVAKLRTAGVR